MKTKRGKNFGFVILYAILMVSVVLTISLSLLNISYKQLIISATGFESRRADAIALSTMRCITFWDTLSPHPDTGDLYTPTGVYFPFGRFDPAGGYREDLDAPVFCGGQESIPPVSATQSGSLYQYGFEISDDPQGPCANVVLIKDTSTLDTTVEVKGYNIACDSPSPRKVERVYTTTY